MGHFERVKWVKVATPRSRREMRSYATRSPVEAAGLAKKTRRARLRMQANHQRSRAISFLIIGCAGVGGAILLGLFATGVIGGSTSNSALVGAACLGFVSSLLLWHAMFVRRRAQEHDFERDAAE